MFGVGKTRDKIILMRVVFPYRSRRETICANRAVPCDKKAFEFILAFLFSSFGPILLAVYYWHNSYITIGNGYGYIISSDYNKTI